MVDPVKLTPFVIGVFYILVFHKEVALGSKTAGLLTDEAALESLLEHCD
jgi:hypothetical protein